MPRTSAPAGGAGAVAITWPSIMGRAATTPGSFFDLRRQRVVIAERALRGIDVEMAVEAEDAAQQLDAEAVHHRHDDDERRDAERDAEQARRSR